MEEGRVIKRSRLLETLGSCPWLVFPHCEDGCHRTFCSMARPFKTYGKSSPKLRINGVLGYSHGWLIISDETIKKPTVRREFISLWNPASSEYISLPPLDLKPDQRIITGSLLSPPGNPGSMVLVFERIVKSFIFCKIGDKEWTQIPAKEMDMQSQIIDEEPSTRNRLLSSSPVKYKGKLYVPMSRQIKVIDQVKPKHIMFRSLNCMLPSRFSHSNCLDWYLVESCGELCVLEVTWGGVNASQVLDIEISRLDFRTMEWSQVRSAKDRGFFFSKTAVYAISCPVNESGIEGGFVHFTVGTDRCLYSFNIEDKSISVSLPWVHLPKSWSTPFWVMPDSSLLFHNRKPEGSQILSKEVNQKEDREDKQILKFSPDKSEAEVRNLCDLPLEIIALIANNLYLVDYINFRLVGKTFRLVAPHVQWRETSHKLNSHSLSPWLMFAQGNSRTLHNFIDPKFGDRYLMNIPESIIDFDIRYSKEGWLLMSSRDEGGSMCFYHPFTKKLISVPPLVVNLERCHSFGFTSLPTSPRCLIVGISSSSIFYFNFSEDEGWFQFERGDVPTAFIPNHTNPVLFEGAFYFLGQQGNLGISSFDNLYDQHMVDWHVHEKPGKPCKSFDQNYLLECDGKLCSVFVDNLGERVQVFEFDYPSMAWRKVRDLGNYMFFVSPPSSFSMVAKTPGMENKIYFPKIKGEEIVYHCLRTAKFRTFGSKQFAANFCNTIEYSFSAWIQQRWL
ncbi:hypothetical protein QQP08_021807 [Theobroma cacao]|nr:hypothetical protein QQP08_021807 [Theobroma cacao]